MPQNLPVSKAARLVGITRGVLQKRIQSGELSTFEGRVSVTELLHLYPETKIEECTMLERVEQIKTKAVRRRVGVERARLDTEILITAISTLKSELKKSSDLIQIVMQKLSLIENTDETNLRSSIITLHNWLKTQ